MVLLVLVLFLWLFVVVVGVGLVGVGGGGVVAVVSGGGVALYHNALHDVTFHFIIIHRTTQQTHTHTRAGGHRSIGH